MKKEKNFAGSKGSNNKIEGYIEKVIKMDSKADTPASVSTPVQQQDGVLYVPTGTLPGSVSDPSTRHELLDAVEVGDVEHLQQLLSTGLDTNAICDDKGRWPLHIAASKGSTEMVSLLLEHGSLADQPDTLGGRTALHLAAASATDTVEVLLQNGATVNVRNKFGYNPLHFAAAAGQAGCCRLLAESNCDVTARDKESLTPLHVASRAGDVWCVEVLLEYGADPGIPDRTGKTPLHHAAESVAILGTDESRAALTIDRLISLGANVNSIDSEGKTALFYAASYGSVDCIKTLLELGAEISDAVTLLNLAKTQPRFVRPFLDKCLKSNLDTYDVDSKNFYVQFDYTPLTFYPQGIQEWKLLQLQNRRDNESFLPEMGVLHGLIKCRDTSILVHPLCESFLRLKWKKIRWFFYFDLFLYALFLAFLTIVIFFSMDASKPMGQEYQFEDIPGNRTSHNATKRMTHYSCLQTTSSAALWAILWALSVILLLREMYHMKLSVENYFKNFNNILKLVLIFTISMLSIAECDDGVLGMWKAREHLAAICLLIGWWVEVVMYGQIPLFSPYMRMFSKIGWDIIKCLVTFIGLVIGFGLTFHHLFKNLKDFQDVGFALLKTLGMLMSELQLQSIFVENDPMVPYTSHIIVILFLLCLSVILMNLLIGLATSGVINMHHEENYMQMRQEIQILTHWEHVLKSRSYLYPTLRARDLKSLFHRKGIIYPNHKDYGRLAHNSIDIVTRMHAMKGKIVMETSATDMVEELLKKLKGKLDKYLLEVERKGGRIMTNLDKYKKSVTALEETVEGVTKNIKQLQDKLMQLNTCLTEMGWPNSNPET